MSDEIRAGQVWDVKNGTKLRIRSDYGGGRWRCERLDTGRMAVLSELELRLVATRATEAFIGVDVLHAGRIPGLAVGARL